MASGTPSGTPQPQTTQQFGYPSTPAVPRNHSKTRVLLYLYFRFFGLWRGKVGSTWVGSLGLFGLFPSFGSRWLITEHELSKGELANDGRLVRRGRERERGSNQRNNSGTHYRLLVPEGFGFALYAWAMKSHIYLVEAVANSWCQRRKYVERESGIVTLASSFASYVD
jgi:hypothetical protein